MNDLFPPWLIVLAPVCAAGGGVIAFAAVSEELPVVALGVVGGLAFWGVLAFMHVKRTLPAYEQKQKLDAFSQAGAGVAAKLTGWIGG